MMRGVFFLVVLCCSLQTLGQSVFSNGSWYKIEIPDEGIYKLDWDLIAANTNWNLEAIDPRTLKIYGHGAGMLPQENNSPRPSSLLEIALYTEGFADGSFDPSDYLLFYAEGPDRLEVEEGHFAYERHLYSRSNYYFVTIGGEDGLRLNNQPPINRRGALINTYDDLLVHEIDEINILKNRQRRGGSGREWFGELFQLNVDLDKSFSFPAEGFTGRGEVIVSTLGQSIGPSAMLVAVNGEALGSQPLEQVVPIEIDPYEERGFVSTDTFAFDVASADEVTVALNFDRFEGGSSLARLDKILVMAERSLVFDRNPMTFRSTSSLEQTLSQFRIGGVSEDLLVWNVTDPSMPVLMNTTNDGSSLSFVEESDLLQKYVIVGGADFPSPASMIPLANQNLRALSPSDGLIIAHSDFLQEAERLADFHRSHDGLDIEVVDVDMLYNEFSSGKPDVTAIRDAVRHYYKKSSEFRYVLLFGDCSYDYLDRVDDNTNLVPIYQSRNSTHPIESYSSDDYFGFMDDDEGSWPEFSGGSHTLEVGIGRLPVKSQKEATDVVNKIIRYATSDRVVGAWKNKVTYVADDGDRNIHVHDAEEFSSIFRENQQQLFLEKLYLDAFEQQIDASNESSPIVEKKVSEALQEGTFTLNYIGHGNEFLWTDEEIFDVEAIEALTNRFKLPLIMTATCQFGRYDDPDFFSGSERLLLNPNGGAIALITTTRPVFASSNELVNEAFHLTLFEKIDGEFPRLGDILRKTKNSSRRRLENRNFALLGDPFLQLRYPEYKAVIDDINGKDIAVETDTLSALEEVTIRGRIVNDDGSLTSTFNGIVDILLLDAPRTFSTLGQESTPISFRTQKNPLFKGQATVTNGNFSASFIVTPNTSYRFDNGKFTLYAIDSTQGIEATGMAENLRLGGTDETVREDDIAPDIRLFVDDPSFQNGQTVQSSALLVAEIFDEYGINVSGSAIHQNLTLQLNGGEPEIINDHFQYDLDSYQRGFVTFPLQDLAPGRYTATIKVWDLYNNSSDQSVEFIVSDLPSLTLTGVVNYPNPAKDETTFTFEHDRIGEEIEIAIDLYDMKGAVVEQLIFSIDDAPGRIDGLTWDLNTSTIQKGIYLYRITVRSTLDGAVSSEFRRLMRN
ncbi:MAG: type IX secretion system sortase PorU [Bacteroidota bacterium]